jgi:hypothetical protein
MPLVLNAQQINTFLRTVLKYFLDKFQAALIKAKVFHGIEMGMITRVVEVYVDFLTTARSPCQ